MAKLLASEEKVATLQSEKEGFLSQIKNLSEDKQNLEYNLSVSNGNLEEAIRVAETPMINGWIYDPAQGWLFTDPDTYPLVYGENAKGWFYYEIGSSAPDCSSTTTLRNGKPGMSPPPTTKINAHIFSLNT